MCILWYLSGFRNRVHRQSSGNFQDVRMRVTWLTVHGWKTRSPKARSEPGYADRVNPFRSRLWRTIILFLIGIALSFLLAVVFASSWPEFCDGTIVGAPCDPVAVRTMAGYLVVTLGFLTMILGPIAGSFIDIAINGAKWEMPRGRDTVVTNMPILVGALFLATGILIIAV